MFISQAFAQTADAVNAQGGSISGTLLQLALIFVIFYFLLIRPQQKKIKQHEAMLASIKKGDTVVTGGGLYATVLKAEDPIDITLQIAEGVVVEANRSTIRDVITATKTDIKTDAKEKNKPANSNKKAKK